MQAHERLYLQYRPDENALEQLLDLQKRLIKANPQGVIVQPDHIHLTLIHFGILADVYRELHEQQPKLTKDFFNQATEQFAQESQKVLPAQTSVTLDKLELFGSRSSVLALRVGISSELREAHAQARTLLEQHIESCGIRPARLFMQGSPNFRFALKLEPHISLIKAARNLPTVSLEADTHLGLQAMPIVYR